MPRVIRVLVHYRQTEDHQPEHVYVGEAQKLRSDLHAAQ
jgi:chorismate mutase